MSLINESEEISAWSKAMGCHGYRRIRGTWCSVSEGEQTMQVAAADGKVSTKLIAMASVAALGGFLFGYDSAIINGAVDAIREEFSLGAGL